MVFYENGDYNFVQFPSKPCDSVKALFVYTVLESRSVCDVGSASFG